jgi:hypothetical protein
MSVNEQLNNPLMQGPLNPDAIMGALAQVRAKIGEFEALSEKVKHLPAGSDAEMQMILKLSDVEITMQNLSSDIRNRFL